MHVSLLKIHSRRLSLLPYPLHLFSLCPSYTSPFRYTLLSVSNLFLVLSRLPYSTSFFVAFVDVSYFRVGKLVPPPTPFQENRHFSVKTYFLNRSIPVFRRQTLVWSAPSLATSRTLVRYELPRSHHEDLEVGFVFSNIQAVFFCSKIISTPCSFSEDYMLGWSEINLPNQLNYKLTLYLNCCIQYEVSGGFINSDSLWTVLFI